MSIEKKSFGFLPDGREVFSFLIDNGEIRAEILNLGGVIKNLWVKDKSGKEVDVVLGYDTLEDYISNRSYFGAVVGRFANRITGGKFSVDGTEYQVTVNNGKNSIHGGIHGFHKHLWNAEMIDHPQNPALRLTTISPDGEEGFPGNLEVSVTYTLSGSALLIRYDAISDKDTIVNLTNHSYFNLNGEGERDIKNLNLTLNASAYTPNSSECVPTGELARTMDSAFDFTRGKNLGEALSEEHPQTALFGGFDHNFAIDGMGFRIFGTLSCEENGITMEVLSDLPGVQLFTANGMNGNREYKNGHRYENHGAVCLETQFFPDSINRPNFRSPLLRKGEKFTSTTVYKFI